MYKNFHRDGLLYSLDDQACQIVDTETARRNTTQREALGAIVREWAEFNNEQNSNSNDSTFDSDALVEKLELLTTQSKQLYENTAELYHKIGVQFPPF